MNTNDQPEAKKCLDGMEHKCEQIRWAKMRSPDITIISAICDYCGKKYIPLETDGLDKVPPQSAGENKKCKRCNGTKRDACNFECWDCRDTNMPTPTPNVENKKCEACECVCKGDSEICRKKHSDNCTSNTTRENKNPLT